MKNLFLLCLGLLFTTNLLSQNIQNPNFANASHPMFVDQISVTDNNLIIKITIENKIHGGNFCADKNIFIQDAISNLKLPLLKSLNIPTCPQTYNFKWIGEKLTFRLYFLKPSSEIKYLNIIEDCDENCFTIFGLILDPKMNKSIDQAFALFDEKNYNSSKETLIEVIEKYPDYPYGNLYLNLIQILLMQNKDEEAKTYYQIISNSDFHDKKFVLDQLKSEEARLK